MRIAIDARGYNWYAGTGIGTYIQNLLKYMLNMDKENEYLLYWHGNNYVDLINKNVTASITSKKHHRFFEEYFIPKNLENKKIDIYHLPQNGMGIPNEKKCKIITTVHDLIPYVMPETVGKGYLKKFISQMPRVMENSDCIITVSNYSKRDILRFFDIDEDKVKVTYLAAEKYFVPLDREYCKYYLKEKYNISDEFLLYLGGFSPRKNVKSIFYAYSKLFKNLSEDIKLVIIGQSRDDKIELEKLSEDLNIKNRIIFTGYVPYEDLPYFYNSCTIFIYPSFYEGFGLPPLEAMSCKTPVIASNQTSIPEVVGDAVLLINPLDTDELARSIELMLSNPPLRESFAEKGYARSQSFSWEKTAESTLRVFSASLLTF